MSQESSQITQFYLEIHQTSPLALGLNSFSTVISFSLICMSTKNLCSICDAPVNPDGYVTHQSVNGATVTHYGCIQRAFAAIYRIMFPERRPVVISPDKPAAGNHFTVSSYSCTLPPSHLPYLFRMQVLRDLMLVDFARDVDNINGLYLLFVCIF